MKRFLLIAFVFGLSFLFGCGQVKEPATQSFAPPYEATTLDKVLKEHEANISATLHEVIPSPSVTVTKDEYLYKLRVVVRDFESIQFFGDYVIATMNAFEAEFDTGERGGISVNLLSDDSMVAFFKSYDSPSFGFIMDDRSGAVEKTSLATVDDLIDMFPAMKIKEAQSQLPEDVVKMFNEVMDRLNAQPSKSEDEIYKQIAPEYNLTPYELKAFMINAMTGMYEGTYIPLPDDYGFTFIEAPASIYTTTGKENGLMNTAMYASGRVRSFGSTSREYEYFVLENDFGTLLISQDDILGKIGNTHRWNELKEGDLVTVYFTYLGWIDEDFYVGGDCIYFTCLYESENIYDQREWTQRWYFDYVTQ